MPRLRPVVKRFTGEVPEPGAETRDLGHFGVNSLQLGVLRWLEFAEQKEIRTDVWLSVLMNSPDYAGHAHLFYLFHV